MMNPIHHNDRDRFKLIRRLSTYRRGLYAVCVRYYHPHGDGKLMRIEDLDYVVSIKDLESAKKLAENYRDAYEGAEVKIFKYKVECEEVQ